VTEGGKIVVYEQGVVAWWKGEENVDLVSEQRPLSERSLREPS
jgi:hypothetical protein